MVLVHYKELDYKVEKLKYNKLGVMQPRIKKQIRPSSWWINHGPDQSTQSFAVVID